jgi:signal transduction histidine kinase
LGYALSLSVAVVGTTAGILMGDYYQQQANKIEKDAIEEITLSNQLQDTLFLIMTHKQQLIFVLEKPELLQQESSEILEYTAKLTRLWSEFKSTEGNTKNAKIKEFPGEVRKARDILQTYDRSLEAYLRQIKQLLKQLEPYDLGSEKVEATQKLLLNFHNSPLAFTIHHLSEDLDKLIKLSYTEYEQAEHQGIAAQKFRVLVVTGSILLSVGLATLLALYTSRAIAQPIQAVTAVAQKVTQEANFKRQVPVTTEDEIGVLAIAFNSLIQRVAEYTQQLEFARQTLEKRVEERTFALLHKNQQLLQAHEELSRKNQQLLQAHEELNQTIQNLRQTQAQLIQTEKMSSLGHLVAGIAHEINNPINFISNNIQYTSDYTQELLELVRLYQQEYPNPTSILSDYTEAIDFDFLVEDFPKILSSMKMGSERICQIILSLRSFYRLDGVEMKEADLHEGLDSTLLILNHQFKQGISIVKQYGDLPLIECYPGQLNQVFMNILQNAIDALQSQPDRPNKQIEIKTQKVQMNQITVRIQDNGSGMPSSIISQIFDPFFTTKPVGKGTGLGLSICYQIIQKHQGQIEVNSQLGAGTEFVITLPIHPN